MGVWLEHKLSILASFGPYISIFSGWNLGMATRIVGVTMQKWVWSKFFARVNTLNNTIIINQNVIHNWGRPDHEGAPHKCIALNIYIILICMVQPSCVQCPRTIGRFLIASTVFILIERKLKNNYNFNFRVIFW